MYCTPAQLVTGSVRLRELGQLFGIAPELLQATIAEADRSAWDADEIAAADAALIAINEELTFATGEVDARLQARGYVLPQDPVRFPVLVVWSRAIARYQLHAERSGEGADVEEGRIERDYLDAREALQLVADGKLTLGAGDPLAVVTTPSTDGAVRITSKPRMFDRDTLGQL
jgi:phage gp36-like protein